MGAANYINQLITKLKKYIDNNTKIVGGFTTPLTAMDRSSKQKINKETRALNDTLDQMDLTDIFRTFHPKAANTHSFRVHMEHSPEQITYWVTNQASTSTKRLRSYHAYFQTTML